MTQTIRTANGRKAVWIEADHGHSRPIRVLGYGNTIRFDLVLMQAVHAVYGGDA